MEACLGLGDRQAWPGGQKEEKRLGCQEASQRTWALTFKDKDLVSELGRCIP